MPPVVMLAARINVFVLHRTHLETCDPPHPPTYENTYTHSHTCMNTLLKRALCLGFALFMQKQAGILEVITGRKFLSLTPA